MTVSELSLKSNEPSELKLLNVGVIASLREITTDVLGNSFSCLTFFSHEMVKSFEMLGLELNSFNVLDRKIFASLSINQDAELSIVNTFQAINDIARSHGLTFDFKLVDIDDHNEISNNLVLTETKASAATLLSRKERYSRVDLVKAINQKSFTVHCQPLVDLSTSNVKGIEFLIRWQHPELGMLFPDQFLPEIERFGLETDLDLMIIDEAISQLVKWIHCDKCSRLSISVNLYCCSLASNRLIESLGRIAVDHPDLVSKLVLEITETGLIEDGGVAHQNMRLLQDIGYAVSLDDFGAGTTICSYLTYLNPNEIKIDRALINTAFSEESKKANVALKMLQSMIGWVQAMENVELVVEGIESQEQLVFLKELGVSVGQGYVYSKPLPVSQLLKTCKGI